MLEDPEVIEISCNPSGDVFVECFGAAPERWGRLDDHTRDRFVRWCATWSGTAITREQPIFSGRIYGTAHRIEALIPPVVEATTFSIRRHSERVITLAEYVPETAPQGLIRAALKAKKNILIAGATGSGKTTFLNACLHELSALAPRTRLVVIEDTPEIRSPLENTVSLRTSERVSMDRLLVSSLRQAPDRIVVGEVRGGAVLMTLIKAWNTGHPGGLVTLHANSAGEVMERLKLLATEVVSADPVPILMQATDMIVFLRRDTDRPKLATIQSANRQSDRGPTMETVYETS